MTTFNRTYRSPKFFMCVHHTEEAHIGFEPAEERFSHFSFICKGGLPSNPDLLPRIPLNLRKINPAIIANKIISMYSKL